MIFGCGDVIKNRGRVIIAVIITSDSFFYPVNASYE